MMSVPPDPLERGGISEFAQALRSHRITCAQVVEMYLERIASLDGTLGAFEYVAADEARSAARALDALLDSGTDLGPLMGVPVALKDIIAVRGMPTTAGSMLDVADLIGSEGGFVEKLRRAGCVILGKLATVEFAGGNVGTNFKRKTPRNPWDSATSRATSGSSSGSGVAMAAGMSGFTVGTDTGGSIRGPAAFCGVVGLKPTAGLWPTDGMFSVSKTFDAVGPLTRSVADAAVVWSALTRNTLPQAAALRGVRLGRPRTFFFDNLDAHVAACAERALAALSDAGAEIVPTDVPEFSEVESLFDTIAYTEAIAGFGRERFLASRPQMNPDVADTLGHGLEKSTEQYIRSVWRHREFVERAKTLFADIDGWIGPTKHHVAPEYPRAFTTIEAHRELSALCGGATRPANLFGLCALTQPIQRYGSPLPVGLQLMCPGEAEAKLLSLGLAFEKILGEPPRPNVSAFLSVAYART